MLKNRQPRHHAKANKKQTKHHAKKPVKKQQKRKMASAGIDVKAVTAPLFASTKLQLASLQPDKLPIADQETADLLVNTLSKGSQPNILSHQETIITPGHVPKDINRRGFEAHIVHNGRNPKKVDLIDNPAANVLVLPASSKIARKYIDDIRSGKVVEQMYNEITKKEQQPLYTPAHTYVHFFRMHERNHRDFLKRLALIENKLTLRFGSTYNLHVSKSIRKFRKRFTVLRSPFVHKKAQDQYEYNHNEYICRVSYAFAITDPVINDFIYEQLKSQVLTAGTGISFGYSVKHGTQRERIRQFTSLSDPVLQTNGPIPDVKQVKFGNYVGQQELLRKHCEANGLDYLKYAGDATLFPFRDKILRARERLELANNQQFGSDVESDPLSELSTLTEYTQSERASDVFKM
eukprot:UN01328